MAVKLSPIGNSQVVDANGNPAVGWTITTYAASSSTPLATYTDATGNTPQPASITLNALGLPEFGQIWLAASLAYKFIFKDAGGVTQITIDNISGINDTSTTVDEWSDSGLTPTYVSATSYTVVGDQTSALHIGRRQKFTVTAGTVYGRIINSVFTTLTTVTAQMDGSQVLDSGLTAVQNAVLRANVLSLPVRAGTASGTDTYAASLGLARYVRDDQYSITFTNANATTTPTLNSDSLGAKTIVKHGSTALAVGDISAGHKALLRYDGTNLVLLNPVVVDASTTVKGKVQLATNAEAVTGTDALKALTPSTMKAGLNASGSAPTYAARSWLNFNSVPATPVINASGNVTSLADLGIGQIQVNFATAMPDALYSVVVGFDTDNDSVNAFSGASDSRSVYIPVANKTTGSYRVLSGANGSASVGLDFRGVFLAVFG